MGQMVIWQKWKDGGSPLYLVTIYARLAAQHLATQYTAYLYNLG